MRRAGCSDARRPFGYRLDIATASIDVINQRYRDWLAARPRDAWARRTLATHGAFLIEYLSPGLRVLDVGCGPGSITRDIADRVAPGPVVGLDIDEGRIATARDAAAEAGLEALAFQLGDAAAMPFVDDSFDVVFVHAVLQHVCDPLKVLRECHRILGPNGVIGVGDTDLAAVVVYPTNPVLDSFFEYFVRLRELDGGSPTVGRQLRTLLHEAGFAASVVSLDASANGDKESMRRSAEAFAAPLEAPSLVAYVEAHHLATRTELEAMAVALKAWGDDPGAMWTSMWFHAIGHPRATST